MRRIRVRERIMRGALLTAGLLVRLEDDVTDDGVVDLGPTPPPEVTSPPLLDLFTIGFCCDKCCKQPFISIKLLKS